MTVTHAAAFIAVPLVYCPMRSRRLMRSSMKTSTTGSSTPFATCERYMTGIERDAAADVHVYQVEIAGRHAQEVEVVHAHDLRARGVDDLPVEEHLADPERGLRREPAPGHQALDRDAQPDGGGLERLDVPAAGRQPEGLEAAAADEERRDRGEGLGEGDGEVVEAPDGVAVGIKDRAAVQRRVEEEGVVVRHRASTRALVAVGLGGLRLLLRRFPLLPELGNATPGYLDRLADLLQGAVDVLDRRVPVPLVGGLGCLQVVPRDLELLLGGEHLVVPARAGGPHGEEQDGGGERSPRHRSATSVASAALLPSGSRACAPCACPCARASAPCARFSAPSSRPSRAPP